MLLRKSKEVSITQTKENMNKRVVIGVKQGVRYGGKSTISVAL